MTLRARLALLYTSIVGGILLLFGVAVYSAVRVSLISQIDNNLRRTSSDILPNVIVDDQGELNMLTSPPIGFSADVFIQVWGRNSNLRWASSNVESLNRPLDPVGLQSGKPVYNDLLLNTEAGSAHLRVLTVPLELGVRPIGVVQVGSSLAVVDATQQALLIVLGIGVVLSMTIAAAASWVSTRQALAPLEDVTQTALQITHADDLSRRIPYLGPPEDEIGQLIHAFNQTLGRLENLFHTQRRFLADVGHELRTPLTVIRGNVDLMRRIGEADEESMDSIVSEVERLARLVGDLLLLAQAESGKLPLDRRLVELDTILFEVFQQIRVLAHDEFNPAYWRG